MELVVGDVSICPQSIDFYLINKATKGLRRLIFFFIRSSDRIGAVMVSVLASSVVHVDVNAELIESTLKQTIACSCFNDFVRLSNY